MMVMAALEVQAERVSVEDFLVNAYMIRVTVSFGNLGTVYLEILQALVDMSYMFGLLDHAKDIVDHPDAIALAVTGAAIGFDGVYFHYAPDRVILRGVNMSIGPGQTVAIVGATGAGKSTIARLLFRFYDVTSGAIRIDGQDIRDSTLVSLKKAIGVVP